MLFRTLHRIRYLWSLPLLVLMLFLVPSFSSDAAEVSVKSVKIYGDYVRVTVSGKIKTDDGYYHLYLQEPYESGVKGEEVAKMPAGKQSTAIIPLNYNGKSLIFHKFQAVIKKEGTDWAVGYARYISNPNEAATQTTKRINDGKKGLLPDANLMSGPELKDLGIQQISYNMPIGAIANGTGISYEYRGKTYQFSKDLIDQYDYLVPLMNKQKIGVTMILLNDLSPDEDLVHPLSRDHSEAHYYAFNVSEKSGLEEMEAVATFLAKRYSRGKHGTIDNWVVGNEVNASKDWNYMDPSAGVDKYVREYVKAFRVFYTAIRSTNANARIYISLDHAWTYSNAQDGYYAGKSFLDKFAERMKQEGDVNWGVAIHPYNADMSDSYALTSTGATDSEMSRYITMRNIDVFTGYMNTEDMLSPSGSCRSILCSEQGYSSGTSAESQAEQAASIVYAYLKAKNNKDIDGFILARETDHADELADGLSYGLITTNGVKKPSYDWYKNAETASVQKQAAQILKVDSLQEED